MLYVPGHQRSTAEEKRGVEEKLSGKRVKRGEKRDKVTGIIKRQMATDRKREERRREEKGKEGKRRGSLQGHSGRVLPR